MTLGKYVGVPVGHEIWIYVGDSGWYNAGYVCMVRSKIGFRPMILIMISCFSVDNNLGDWIICRS